MYTPLQLAGCNTSSTRVFLIWNPQDGEILRSPLQGPSFEHLVKGEPELRENPEPFTPHTKGAKQAVPSSGCRNSPGAKKDAQAVANNQRLRECWKPRWEGLRFLGQRAE